MYDDYGFMYLRILKHISWSWNCSGGVSALSQSPRKRCKRTSTEPSSTLPWSRYSWFGIMLLFRAEDKLSMAVLTGILTQSWEEEKKICFKNANISFEHLYLNIMFFLRHTSVFTSLVRIQQLDRSFNITSTDQKYYIKPQSFQNVLYFVNSFFSPVWRKIPSFIFFWTLYQLQVFLKFQKRQFSRNILKYKFFSESWNYTFVLKITSALILRITWPLIF